MFSDMTENLVLDAGTTNWEDVLELSARELGFTPNMDPQFFFSGNEGEVIDAFQQQFIQHYNEKNRKISEHLMPAIPDVYNRMEYKYKRIALPYSDGSSHPINLQNSQMQSNQTANRSLEM